MKARGRPDGVPGYGAVCLRSALVSHAPEFVYLELPKVACTSLKQALGSALGVPQERIATWRRYGLPVVDLAGPQLRALPRFSFVRNPWDRLVSCWENKFNHPDPRSAQQRVYAERYARHLGVPRVDFELFVRMVCSTTDDQSDPHWRSQVWSLTDLRGESLVTCVGRFEQLAEDFETLCAQLGLRASLPRAQVTAHRRKDYRSYYTPETAAAVAQRYATDIESLGYSFDR